MHKVYENNDLAMYFKKRYCCQCGLPLSRKSTERVVKKGDPDHSEYCSIGRSYKPYGDILVVGKEYYCEKCGRSFSCREQSDVIDAQNEYKKKIVSSEEIRAVKTSVEIEEANHLKALSLSLLIPLIGGILCCFYISNHSENKRFSRINIKIPLIVTTLLCPLILLALNVLFNVNELTFLKEYLMPIGAIASGCLFNVLIALSINKSL